MTIINSLLDINNISVVQIEWDNIQDKPILAVSTITSDYNNAGNIGIGVSNPISKLDVNGTINALEFSKNGMNLSNIFIASNQEINLSIKAIEPIFKNSNTISLNYDTSTLSVINSNLTVLNTSKWITSNNNIYINNYNVGIGTSNPNSLYKLDINGTINATDIYINNTSVNTRINNNFIILNNLIDNTNKNFLNIINNINNNEKTSLIIKQTNSNTNVAEFYNSNNIPLIINSNLNVGIGTTLPLYTLDVNGTINCSSLITNGYNMNFKKNFYFSPVLNSGSYEYIFDIRNYIPNSVGNDIRCFNIYGHNSNGNFNNSSNFSGAYLFFISGFNGGTGKKVILNETGGTIDYIPQYQMKYSSLNSANGVYMTIHQHN
jgi:hypothetical protein